MKKINHLFGRRRLAGLAAVVLTASVLFWAGCDTVQSPDGGQDVPEAVLSRANPAVQAAMRAQASVSDDIMSRQGVAGLATGMTAEGRPSVLVLLESEAAGRGLPRQVNGVPVTTLVTGEIKAIKGGPPGGNNFDTTAKHRPAPNGVSIGHPDITAGTLGCLVTDGSMTYILSNNHVMANENNTANNAAIYQPGPFDGGTAADQIATLSDFEPIVFSTSANNVIDAAIAEVDPADVTGETEPGGYGAPLSTTANASIGMRVQKYGRTTEETSGRVQGINATVNVGYDSGTARFVDQIVIGGGGFSSGGDSGSCIVGQRGADARKPVGLLFAGGGGSTIANPIEDVLSAFNKPNGVTIVGDSN